MRSDRHRSNEFYGVIELMAEHDENVVPVYDVPEQPVLVGHIVEQADGLVGARVVTFDGTGVSRDEAIEREAHNLGRQP